MGSIALALMLLATGALELEWTVPDSCPTKEVALARLGPLAGSAVVVVTERHASFEVVVSVAGTERALTSRTCAEATDAAVLIIQLALQPGVEATDAGIAPMVIPERVDAGSAPAPADPSPTTLQLGASAGLLIAWVPATIFHAGVDFSVARGPFFGFARVHTGTRPTLALSDGSAVEFALHGDAAIGACWRFGASRVRVGPCAGGGLVVAQASTLRRASEGAWLLLAPWGGLAVRASLTITAWLEAALWGWARFAAFPVLQAESRTLVSGSPVSADVVAGLGGQW